MNCIWNNDHSYVSWLLILITLIYVLCSLMYLARKWHFFKQIEFSQILRGLNRLCLRASFTFILRTRALCSHVLLMQSPVIFMHLRIPSLGQAMWGSVAWGVARELTTKNPSPITPSFRIRRTAKINFSEIRRHYLKFQEFLRFGFLLADHVLLIQMGDSQPKFLPETQFRFSKISGIRCLNAGLILHLICDTAICGAFRRNLEGGQKFLLIIFSIGIQYCLCHRILWYLHNFLIYMVIKFNTPTDLH